MDEQIALEVMDERLQRLQATIAEGQYAFNRASVGRRCAVLLERPGRKPGQLIGKSPWLQSVVVESEARIGDLIEVDLVAAGPNSLTGVIVVPAQAGIAGPDVSDNPSEIPAFAGMTVRNAA